MKLSSRKFAAIPKAISLALAFGFLFCGLQRDVEAQWVQTNGPTDAYVQGFVFSGDTIIAHTGGFFNSTNNGQTWTTITTYPLGADVFSFVQNGVYLFASGGVYGIFFSTNDGVNWDTVSTPPNGFQIGQVLACCNRILFVSGASGGVYRSTDNGQSWSTAGLSDTTVSSFVTCGSQLYATTAAGTFCTSDNGNGWVSLNNSFANHQILVMVGSGSARIAGTSGGGVFLSTNAGGAWVHVGTGLPDTTVNALCFCDSILFAGTQNYGIFQSLDKGISWSAVNNGVPLSNNGNTKVSIISFAINNGDICSTSLGMMRNLFGNVHGSFLWNMAHGRDARPLTKRGAAKSISHQSTLQKTTSDKDYVESLLLYIAERCLWRLRTSGMKTRSLSIYMRFADQRYAQRMSHLKVPTQSEQVIFPIISEMTQEIWASNPKPKVTFIGVHLSDFQLATPQEELFTDGTEKKERLSRAMGSLREKFHSPVVTSARTFGLHHSYRLSQAGLSFSTASVEAKEASELLKRETERLMAMEEVI